MKTIPVENAVGSVLCHDITRYVAGEQEKVAFRKGHIVQEKDIPLLLDLGKKNLFVLDLAEDMVHEDEAAYRIAQAACGEGLDFVSPHGGKVLISSSINGLLKINIAGLQAVHEFEEVALACIHTNQRVNQGRVVAAARIIPLTVQENILKSICQNCSLYDPIIEVKPFRSLKVAIITTGSEIYERRIQDSVGPILKKKIEESGSVILEQTFVPDSLEMISGSIHSMLGKHADLILLTGGMSVDPDDVTPASIRKAGARTVTYGVPVVPGAAFLLAYIGIVPVLGLPGCIMYYKTTVFDLIYPRIQAGEVLEREDITKLAHGGLCVGCGDCKYPDCGFGKGV